MTSLQNVEVIFTQWKEKKHIPGMWNSTHEPFITCEKMQKEGPYFSRYSTPGNNRRKGCVSGVGLGYRGKDLRFRWKSQMCFCKK